MTNLTFLEVPFEDKDEVKALGAKWHSDRKKWFVPTDKDPSLFKEWIPEYDSELTDRAIAPFYLLKSKESCWKCGNQSSVITFAASGLDGGINDYVKFLYVAVLPERLKAFVEKYYPNYFIDYSNTTESYYYINHCEMCKASLGDFYMHSEPEHAFFPQTVEAASGIEIVELKSSGYVKITASESVGVIDFILKHGAKSEFKKT